MIAFWCVMFCVVGAVFLPQAFLYPGGGEPVGEYLLRLGAMASLLPLFRRRIKQGAVADYVPLVLFFSALAASSLFTLDKPRTLVALENWLSYFAIYVSAGFLTVEETSIFLGVVSVASGLAALAAITRLFPFPAFDDPVFLKPFLLFVLPLSAALFRLSRRRVKILCLVSIFLSLLGLAFQPRSKVAERPTPLLWKTSFSMMGKKPVFGSGPGTFSLAFQGSPYPVLAQQAVAHLPENAGNNFLTLGVELGGLGLFLYLLVVVYSLKRFLAHRSSLEKRKAVLGDGLALAAVIYLFLCSYTVPTSLLTFLFWLALGSLSALHLEKEETFPETDLSWAFLFILFPLVAMGVSVHEVRLMEANYDYTRANLIRFSNVPLTVQLLSKAVLLDPGNDRFSLELSDYYLSMAETLPHLSGPGKTAIQLLQNAICLHPHEAALYAKLGNLYTRLYHDSKSQKKALALYQKAITLDRANPFYHNQLGMILIQMGIRAEAKKEFQEALFLYPAYRRPKDLLMRLNSGGTL